MSDPYAPGAEFDRSWYERSVLGSDLVDDVPEGLTDGGAPRLRVLPMTLERVPDAWALFAANRHFWDRFQPAMIERFHNEQVLFDAVKNAEEEPQLERFVAEAGPFEGYIAFADLWTNDGTTDEYAMRISLGEEFLGQGYATRIVRVIANEVLNVRKARVLRAFIDPEDEDSIVLFQRRLGFALHEDGRVKRSGMLIFELFDYPLVSGVEQD